MMVICKIYKIYIPQTLLHKVILQHGITVFHSTVLTAANLISHCLKRTSKSPNVIKQTPGKKKRW